MTTLKVGIASYEDMKARTLAVTRGERRIASDEPKVWFTSTESFAKVLSAGNRELLRVIMEQASGSLDELARITGKAKSNLSRTLRTMEGYGLVRLERGERGRITPKVVHDRVELDLPLTLARKAGRAMTLGRAQAGPPPARMPGKVSGSWQPCNAGRRSRRSSKSTRCTRSQFCSEVASRKGIEPLTYGLGNRRSILLSYRDMLAARELSFSIKASNGKLVG